MMDYISTIRNVKSQRQLPRVSQRSVRQPRSPIVRPRATRLIVRKVYGCERSSKTYPAEVRLHEARTQIVQRAIARRAAPSGSSADPPGPSRAPLARRMPQRSGAKGVSAGWLVPVTMRSASRLPVTGPAPCPTCRVPRRRTRARRWSPRPGEARRRCTAAIPPTRPGGFRAPAESSRGPTAPTLASMRRGSSGADRERNSIIPAILNRSPAGECSGVHAIRCAGK